MNREKGTRKRGQQGEDEATPARQQVRDYVESNFVVLLMTAVTLFALFGEDLLYWHTTSQADPYFQIGLVLSLALFTLELLVQSCVVDDYKYSFFFWLDFIATFSLIPDIAWLWDSVLGLMEVDQPKFSLDVKPGDPIGNSQNSKIAKATKSFRLMRLIRIIKLYNYVVKSGAEAEEARLREQQKLSANAQQAALKKELEPSRLGKHLSDTLTRRLTMIILGLLMALPVLAYAPDDYTANSGLRELFWFGRSSCESIDDEKPSPFCNSPTWITPDGWEEKLRQFVLSHRGSEGETELSKRLLWLYVPDFNKNGALNTIESVGRAGSPKSGDQQDEPLWKQTDECAGFKISDKNCPFRVKEMALISYIPPDCESGKIPNCKDLVAYARFDTRAGNVQSGKLSFIQTIFTCILMTAGSILFSRDTDNIIIAPISKMVTIIKQLADDPLQKPEPPVFDEETEDNNLKTKELRKTIYRIGCLLQMCFGQLGALIIREGVSGGDG